VKEGDTSTKYFHAHTIIRHRKNTIACLQDDSGNSITDHEGKAKILWESFKDILGKSEFKEMLYNLNVLITNNEGLNELEAPLSKQEIDSVISELPNNKSPGPDGYNNEFIKGWWSLIAPNYYRLFEAFFEEEICLRSINSSLITLIPKKDGPSTTVDYRPISLLNTSLKLITKVLANRL